MTVHDAEARRTPTREDVARMAGVSNAVVSYVVNDGPKRVAPKTASRVRAAVDKLGYSPNLAARALQSGSTKLLGLVLPDWGNPFFAEFTQAIASAAARRQHSLVITTSGEDPDSERVNIAELVAHRVDGLLVSSLREPDALREWVAHRPSDAPPVVLLNSELAIEGLTGLGSAFADGAAMATAHLLGHGHRSVAVVTGERHADRAAQREVGWRRAHEVAGRRPGPAVRKNYAREGGYVAGMDLLRRARRPTAIFAVSDLIGVGVLRAAHELGLRIPDDLAVITFDGTRESEFSWPPLTTVRQPVEAMATEAIRLILDPPSEQTYRRFDTELIVRRSCGCQP